MRYVLIVLHIIDYLQAGNIRMKDQKIEELLDHLKEYQKTGEYIKAAAKKLENFRKGIRNNCC